MRFFDDHPDWSAVKAADGTRNPYYPCYSHPGVLSARVQVTQDVYDGKGGWFGDHSAPGPKWIGFEPKDLWDMKGLCQCDRCKPQYQVQRGRFGRNSDLLFRHGVEYAAEISKRWPDKRLGMLAYEGHMLPPDFALPENMDVQVCMMWSTTMGKEPYWHERNLQLMRDWSKKLGGKRERLYVWNFFCYPAYSTTAPIFFPHNLQKWLQDTYAISGGEFVCPGGSPPQYEVVMAWLWHRLMWDRSADVDALLRDQCMTFFGSAGKTMEKAYTTIIDRYENVRWSRQFDSSHVPTDQMYGETYTPQVVSTLKKLMQEALAACPKGETNVCRRRVVWMRLPSRPPNDRLCRMATCRMDVATQTSVCYAKGEHITSISSPYPALISMLVLTLLCGPMVLAQANDAPAHGRPFFMPAQERTRIRQLIAAQEWAKADYTRIQEAARKGDGLLAAFLYALDGDPVYVPIAQKWLLGKFGAGAGTTKRARGALDNPEFFEAGVPHLGDVFYDTDFSPYIGFDWVYSALEPAARREIQEGISAFMHFKMRCMDRWTQTPNLVFKPTAIVAFAGLALRDREMIEWGLYRNPKSRIGGYLPVLNNMLKDGGPWHEAPIYPIAHTDLYCMGMVSRYRALYDGKDWWTAKTPSGGSPKGLMDYYIDSAYPIERTGYGPGQIRVATYGDGATNAKHDLFLVNPAGPAIEITKALIAAYNASGDPRLAPFVAMIHDYTPTLTDRRPLPEKIELPSVSSKIWPDYGLAILRAEESPAYWNSDAPVVFQLMAKGYSHDHFDKLSIIFHGAGRLLYPDYNAIQYENASIGWTRNTIAHNTLMVDEGDTRSARPSDIRHAFTPEVKYLATSASGVFEKVDQTRALLLTREYLLDIFHAASPTPRVYDYMLHSFGTPRPAHPELFKPSNALDKRFWLVSDRQAMTTDRPWALDFVIKEQPGSRKGKFGPEWYDHTAAVRVTMAAEPKTLVTHGISGIELGKAVKRTFDPLGMLIARRAGVRQTVFAATHEPYANAAKPRITTVTQLAQSGSAVLVRVDAADFTDYAAVAFGAQPGTPEQALAAADDPKTRVAFRDYGYLRVRKDGTAVARGGWTGFSLPTAKAAITLNGQPARATVAGGYLVFGILPATQTAHVEPECPFPVTPNTAVARLAQGARRAMTFTVKNTLEQSITGTLAFELPAGVTVEPAAPQFGPLAPGATAQVRITCIAGRDAAQGKRLIPYRVSYRTEKAAQEIRTAALPFDLVVNSVLEYVYRYPKRNVFRVTGQRYIVEMDMDHGLTRYLADDDETVRLNGSPLFTFSDGKKPWLFEGASNNYTWAVSVPAALKGAPSAYGDCRYLMNFKPDRITMHMDAGWTRFDPTYFTVPGQWTSPQGAPTWARIIAVDANGKEVEAKPGTKLKIAAAELAFPGAKWHLAFAFAPPQPVTFEGTEMRFPIGSLNGDAWSVGFCKPGELDAWRKGQ